MSAPHGSAQRLRTDLLAEQPALQRVVRSIFGSDEDTMQAVVDRAHSLLGDRTVMVWEADPLTFSFTYVSPEAEQLLGFAQPRWKETGFWSAHVVHPDDVGDALSHCALATAAGEDHDFEYRARTADGRVVRVHDVVHVLKGPLGFVSALRGIMFPVPEGAA